MRYFILLALGLLSFHLSAQRTVSGIVVEASSGEPMVFVHVFLKNKQAKGVITNEDGQYSIQLTADELEDELVFSLLGFQTHFEPLAQVEGPTFNLKMQRSFIALDEIVVTSDLGLRNIIRRVMKKVSENYGHDNYLIQSYYRSYTMTDDTVSQYIDGMITYKDKTYNDPKRPVKGWVDEYRASDNFRHERFRGDKKDYNRILGMYERFNPIRQRRLHWLLNFFRKKGDDRDPLLDVPLYNRGEYLENGDTLLRIAYELFPVKKLREDGSSGDISYYLLKGEVLINLTDMAILRNTVSSREEGIYDDVVYRKYRGKYYPERMQWSLGFEHDQKTRHHYENRLLFFYNVMTTKAEMKAYKKGKMMLHDVAFDPRKIPYNPSFWEENQLLIRLPGPDRLQEDLNRVKNLDQQYRDNARQQ